jgi:hypothetical protein
MLFGKSNASRKTNVSDSMFGEIFYDINMLTYYTSLKNMSILLPVSKVKNSINCKEFYPLKMKPIYERVLGTLVTSEFMIVFGTGLALQNVILPVWTSEMLLER